MASLPANKWQGIFLVFHQIFLPAEAPQWLLIQSLFMASDEGFQMRLHCNESDTSMWPLSRIEGVSHLAEAIFVPVQFSPWAAIHLFPWSISGHLLQASSKKQHA